MGEIYRGAVIEIDSKELEKLMVAEGIDNYYTRSLQDRRYNTTIRVSLYELPKEFLPKLLEYIQQNFVGRQKSSAEKKLKQYMNILSSFRTKVPKNLPDLVNVLRLKVAEDAYSYALVFTDENGNQYLRRVKSIEYHPYSAADEMPAYVEVCLSFTTMGKSSSARFTIHSADLNKSLEEILAANDYTFATEQDYKDYMERYNRFIRLHDSLGKQLVLNTCSRQYVYRNRDDYRGRYITLQPGSKVLVSTPEDNKIPQRFEYPTFFKTEDTEKVEPLMMFDSCSLSCFSLDAHAEVELQSAILDDYVYRDDIADKLVIPEATRNCLDILLSSSDYDFSDVVDNKSGGLVVLSSGPAGCGKTLTAQVYSEIIHKPLYTVQSSQLGMTAQDVEKNLTEILYRASRLGCVLLIDEADVFIRRRGDDLEQNAIVGVFLRTLEHYSGVLFFTTNRFLDTAGEQFVDDAILSRCTCHLRYKLPNAEERKKIFEIQITEAGLSATAAQEVEILKVLEDSSASGRDIRNLIKLSKLFLAKSGETNLDAATVKKVIPFHSTLQQV